MICPYFRKSEDECDVGSGYISSHDVKIMVSFCRSRYLECSTFKELSSRVSAGAAAGEQAGGWREAPAAAIGT